MADEHGPDADTFEFSFGDVPLCQLNEDTAEVEAFIYQYLPLRRFFEQPYPPAGGWMASPDSQWPETPELNTLYWPTGCTRWGFGCFLFSGEFLSRIQSAVASGFGTLKIGNPDDPDHYIEATMAPLSPVAITGNSSTSDDTNGYPLYLLPLVDKRYRAQTYGGAFGSPTVQPGDTVPAAGPFISANTAVGGASIPFHAQALPDYAQYFDAVALSATVPDNLHSAMQTAESAAWSLGLTLVMELDGTGGFMHRDAFTASDTNSSRLNQLRSKISAGDYAITAGYIAGADDQANLSSILKPSIPASLRLYVASPAAEVEADNFIISGSKEFVVLSSEILGYLGQGQHWFICSPIIRDVDRDPDGTPSGTGTTEDDDKCDQLAYDLANEWYNQVGNPIDVTFADICNVPLSSHTDIVEWHFDRRGPQTRVRSRRWNAFPNRLINQFKSPVEDNHAPHRWERVTVKSGESGVRWNGKDYDAVWPILQDGFKQFDEGDTVNAGWEPITRKFYVADQRPLDIDALGQLIADWLENNGYFNDTGADVNGGGL